MSNLDPALKAKDESVPLANLPAALAKSLADMSTSLVDSTNKTKNENPSVADRSRNLVDSTNKTKNENTSVETKINQKKDQKSVFKCSVCLKTFMSEEFLILHEEKHANTVDPKAKKSMDFSNVHGTSVNTADKTKILVASTEKTKDENQFIETKISKKTDQKTVFKCYTCHKAFKTEEFLILHKEKHAQTCRYNCEVCGTSYTDISALRQHEQNKHNL